MKHDQLPRSVKVGRRTYRIVPWTGAQGSAAQRYGQCSHINLEISLDVENHGLPEIANTLLHEIMHAICSVWELRDADDEERSVSILASGLSTVWRDSPDVFEWLARHHR